MKILKKLSFLTKMPFTGILLMILIVSMALATFIESGRGTNAAWALIYDAWWFEAIFVIVLVNLVGNIIRFRLYRKSAITVFVFHLAFIIIIVGAGITRYISVEGMMHIREGDVSSTMISDDTYMEISVRDETGQSADVKKVRLSVLTPRKFRWSGDLNGKKIRIRSKSYMQNAVAQYVGSPGGVPYMQMIMIAGGQHNVGLTGGERASYPGISVSFNLPESTTDLQIVSNGDSLTATSQYAVSITSMGGEAQEEYAPGTEIPIERGKLYTLREARFALQRYIPSARLKYVEAGSSGQTTGMDVVKLEVSMNGMKSELFVPGGSNMISTPAEVSMGSTTVSCRYGARNIRLPFALKLEDFRIDRYPGSNSPSSFESDVMLIDKEKGIEETHNIYMNNVLKHRGYRFYQSSYDQDEKGTILSVNRDLAGTTITYFGYIMLAVGVILSLFAKGTRFAAISRSASKNSARAVVVLVLVMFSVTGLHAQQYPVPSEQASEDFGELWVQGKEGRFKPMNTLSNEVMRKVLKKSGFRGYTADQVMLGMITYPDQWKQVPIFEIDNPELQQLLGYRGSVVSFNDFIVDGRYILSQHVNNAYTKRVQDRDDLDKEVMKLDEKINVFYMVQSGSLLKIFPDPDAADGKWHSVAEMLESATPENDTLGKVFLLYTRALREQDNEIVSNASKFLHNYQLENSAHELSMSKKKAEILYNKANIFDRLFKFYFIFGFALLILQFMRIFRNRKWVEKAFGAGVIILLAAFIIHSVFLGVRWYVSGHAPLSNGYESMIFVSWITLMAGLIFVRRTGFAAALTAIMAALSLMVAHMSWMNPDITNLVPVLKSPWLTIHVTVIMTGYGFLAMSMLMGLNNLVLYSVLNRKNKQNIALVIEQVTKVNHLALIIGLYFLTVGTFLGGVWANESWGRYWGWDPKETWALISVLVYAFIAHMNHFPGMKGAYIFNLASVLGYFSILMTYFGVNYFLGGIHSYAGGAAFDIPTWVYIVVISVFALALLAYNRKKILSIDYLPES